MKLNRELRQLVLGRTLYFPSIRYGPHRKRCLRKSFIAKGKSLATCYLLTIEADREREREKKVGGGSERHYRLEGGVTET
jgi:hypothetical protein